MHRLHAGTVPFSLKNSRIHSFLYLRGKEGSETDPLWILGEDYIYTFSKYDFMIELYSSKALLYYEAFPVEMQHTHLLIPGRELITDQSTDSIKVQLCKPIEFYWSYLQE